MHLYAVFTELHTSVIDGSVGSSLTKYSWGYQIQKNEVGGACGTYGEQDTCIQGFGGET
jgi:hypothetical protein